MITIYFLNKCKFCDKVIKYLKNNPNRKVCTIFIGREDVIEMKKENKNFKSFPLAFTGSPRSNGLPKKNALSISGSNKIISILENINKEKKKLKRNNFGELNGDQISINYENNNQGNISNLSERHTKCFGNCHVMDRLYGKEDLKYISDNQQPNCAIPIRSNIPVKKITSFGKKVNNVNNKDTCVDSLKQIGMNIPMSNHFGNSKDCNKPLLTYAAGGNTINRRTGRKYYNDQKPEYVQNYSNSYIHKTKNKSNKFGKTDNILTTPLGIEISLN